MTHGEHKKGGLLFIVSAPSGAGKTTLCKELADQMPGIAHSVSHTTRKPRPGEVEGEHYYFVSEERFRAVRDEGGFVEWAQVYDNYYGTSRAELARLYSQGKDVMLDIDTQGAAKIKASGENGVFIFILPPSLGELERRLRGRDSDDEAEIQKRLRKAADEIKSYRMYDYMIVNDDKTKALDTLRSIVVSEKSRRDNLDAGWLREKFGV